MLSRDVRASSRAWRLAAMLATFLVAFLLVAHPALADDYSIDQVDIDATVQTDGSLVVKEVREFDFDGSFHGVYWKIPTGSYEGRDIVTSILSVGEIIDGAYVEFTEDYSGDDHTYQITEYSDYVQVKLYSAHEDESAQFGIAYQDDNLATRYDDVSELYWKFVSDGWDVESRNVTCTVHLPVPGGVEVTGGENVRAWGHGPLDATVGFDNGDVIYDVPGVGTSEFAEARVVFPAEWLSDTQSVGGAALDKILAEEQEWADEANARRAQARALMTGASAVGFGMPVLSLVYAAFVWTRYRGSHKPQFDDKYFRDVPSDDHPAVLGALLEGDGKPTDECLTASLMRLTDQGYAKLELVKTAKKGAFGREKIVEDYCLTPLKWPERTSNETAAERVDFETMRYLFDRLTRLTARETGDADSLYFKSLEKAARSYPETFEQHRDSWVSAIEAECDRRGFFIDDKETGQVGLYIVGGFSIFIGIASFIGMLIFDGPFLLTVGLLVAGIFCGASAIAIATRLDDFSPEALELRAKLKALRNWLKDFTRLDEAVPQDVVLWNRLLVMAVVLGVSEEVIKQLKVAAPQVLDDPYLSSTYGWYYGPSHSPIRSFTDASSTAHSVSTAKLADSSDSSGGGGGGGFSGGGGGGFGGGGGGGAF